MMVVNEGEGQQVCADGLGVVKDELCDLVD